MRLPASEAVDRTYGRLKVIALVGTASLVRCHCACGAVREYPVSKLRNGDVKSCGCLKTERFTKFATKHGHRYTPEYKVWLEMRNRCRNPRCKMYPFYGRRGITVCERWDDYKDFIADMGPRPPGDMSIERRENDGPYAPDNCYWATRFVQANNKQRSLKLTHNSRTMAIAHWSRLTGIPYATIYHRLKVQGLSHTECLRP